MERTPAARAEDSTSSSDRTVSFEHVTPGDHSADNMEVDSNIKPRDQNTRLEAQKHVKRMTLALKTDHGKSVDHSPQEVQRIPGKGGVLKILPKNNKDVGGTSKGNLESKDHSINREIGDSSIVPTKAKMAPLTWVEDRKKCLPLPQWLKDYKSKVVDVDLDGWKIVAVERMDSSGRKDKYYTHRDYGYTFRSKVDVKHFLDTGEAKGKGPQKKSAVDRPSGQSSGSRRSEKRRMLQPPNDPPEPIGFRHSVVGGMFHNLREAPPGYL